jgi:Holliday junction resolvase RusA-like endonuclease
MHSNKNENIVYKQNPNLDYLFGYFGNEPITTKQDKFKPIEVIELDENGNEQKLNDFYVKNPSQNASKRFHDLIVSLAKEIFEKKEIIKKPQLVEVYLSITMKETRFKQVDVDNLAKSVLDCLTGIVYEDDSQISNLIVCKSVHPMKVDSIMIGITKLNEERKGLLGNIELFKKKE